MTGYGIGYRDHAGPRAPILGLVVNIWEVDMDARCAGLTRRPDMIDEEFSGDADSALVCSRVLA